MFGSLYTDLDTPLHRLDPRTKIIALIFLSVLCFVFNHPLYVCVITFAILAIAGLARSLGNYYRARYLLLFSLIVPVVAWQFFLRGPTVIGHLGPVLLTREALLYGLASGVRYSSIMMVGILFAATMPVEDFQIGLIKLGTPYPVAFVLSLAMRLVPTFASVLTNITEVQVARGLDLESRNPLRLARNVLPLVIPFLVYALRYGFHLSMALESRGFSVDAERTYLRELAMTSKDWLILFALAAVAATAVSLRLHGYGAVLHGRL